MRELVYYVAVSLDGFIAREDGDLSGFPYDEAYGAALAELYPETFPQHLRATPLTREQNVGFDAVIMGRRTYEVGLRAGVTRPYDTLDQYVFSRSLPQDVDTGVRVVREPAVEVVRELKRQTGKAIWLCGGAELAGHLLRAGLIDRVIVKLNPVLFGRGLPMFAGEAIAPAALRLTDQRTFQSGHVLIAYALG